MNLLVIGAVAAGAWLLLRKKEPAGAAEFDVGLQGPAALPNTDEVIGELFRELKVDPGTVADAVIELPPGSSTNLLRFATRTGAAAPVLPPIGTNLTVSGVPLQIISVDRVAIPAIVH
jgi:hypothetical protein